jgi:hypothetical protein
MKYTTLPEITSRVLKARESGTDEETITAFLKQRGWTPERFTDAVNKQTAKDEVMPEEQSQEGGGFWNSVNEGLEYFNKATDSLLLGRTFGLTVPARATGRWAKSKLVDDESISFSDAVDSVQEEDKEWSKENPNVAMGTEMVGGMAAGGEVAKGLTTSIPKLAPVATQWSKNLVKGSILHGGSGMAEGAALASAKDENIFGGAIAGLVGGVGGEIVMPVAKWVGKKIFDPIQELFSGSPKKTLTTAEIRAEQMLEEVDIKDGITPEIKKQKLDEYTKLKLATEVTAVDLMGKKGQNLAGTIMRNGDAVPDKAETLLVKRAGRVRQHLFDFLQDATGGTRVSQKKAVDTFKKAAKEESAPVYDVAFYNGGKMRTVSGTDLNDLFKMPEFKDAYKRAIYLAKHDTPPVTLAPMPKKGFPEGHRFPVYALDKVKKAIGSKTKGAFSSPDPNARALAGTMTGHKNKMLDIIGESNSDYKEARNIYAGSMEFKDATELGQKLFDSGDSFDKIYEAGNKLKTESEKREFRNAAFNALSKKIESSSVNPKGMAQFFMNKQNMKKLELLIPDPEKRGIFMRQTELLSDFVDVKNKIIGGSQTAEKLASDVAEEDLNEGLKAVGNLASRNYTGLGQQLNNLGNTTARAARLDAAGEKVFTQRTPDIRNNQQGSKITNELLKKQMTGRSLLQGSVTGGGASLMNSLLQ